MNDDSNSEAASRRRVDSRKQRIRRQLQFGYWYLVISMILATTALYSIAHYTESGEEASFLGSFVAGTINAAPIYAFLIPLIPLGLFLYRKSRW